MATRELTDEEVFGGRAPVQRELTDAEVFGAAPSKNKKTFGQSAMLGLKKGASGVMELGANIGQALGADTSEFKANLADVQQDYEAQGKGTGVKGFIGEIAGNPLTYIPVGKIGTGIGALTKILGQGAIQGVAAPTGNEQSTLADNEENAGYGSLAALGGSVVGKTANKVFRPVANNMSDNAAKLASYLESQGVPLTAAQKTGSKALASLEGVFEKLPLTSGTQKRIADQQSTAFTKAALAKAGISTDDASRKVISDAAKQFGKEYGELAANNVMNIDEPLLQTVAGIYQEANSGRLGQDASNLVKSVASDIFNSGGQLKGDVYQKTRSLLTQKSASATDAFDAGLMKQLRNALDEAFERSLPESQRGVMANINARYQAFKPIQKAMEASKINALRNAQIDPVSLYGQVPIGSPLEKLSDAGAAFIRPQIGDSGTAERLFWQNALTGAGLLSTGAGAYGVGGDYAPILTGAGLALAGPRAAQALYNSKAAQSYVTKGLPGQKVVKEIARQLPKLAAAGWSSQQIKELRKLPPAEAIAIINQLSAPREATTQNQQ